MKNIAVRQNVSTVVSLKKIKDDAFSSLFNLSANPKFIMEKDSGKIIHVNDAFSRSFGYDGKSLKKLNEAEFWVGNKFKSKWLEVLSNKGSILEFPAYLYDFSGEIRSVLLYSVISKSDDLDIIITEIIDNTEKEKIATNLQSTILKLNDAMESMISVIAHTVELKDPYTAGHQKRVAILAEAIAKKMKLPPNVIEGIRIASIIHDIGKIAIPVEILSKPGKLSPMEFELIKTHSVAGYNILKDIEFEWPLAEMVYQHHERIDGSGYPRGLKGDEIIIEAKIISIADVIEAISFHRPYRPSLGTGVAIRELNDKSGIFYDKEIVKISVDILAEGIDLS